MNDYRTWKGIGTKYNLGYNSFFFVLDNNLIRNICVELAPECLGRRRFLAKHFSTDHIIENRRDFIYHFAITIDTSINVICNGIICESPSKTHTKTICEWYNLFAVFVEFVFAGDEMNSNDMKQFRNTVNKLKLVLK